ncbi:hypothetical protein ACW2Q0_17930 [Nocardia sp. R16R-3T]
MFERNRLSLEQADVNRAPLVTRSLGADPGTRTAPVVRVPALFRDPCVTVVGIPM